MHKILTTAYAVNPKKGSEDGMGWNFILQIARNNKVTAITRKNNEAHIVDHMQSHPSELYKNITFQYYDLPYYLRFWKKQGRGAMLYFYLWQLTVPLFILKKKLNFDLVHNLNFHNNWTPSFLWLTKKPFVWGPVGNHPAIPMQYLKKYGIKAILKDRLTWMIKRLVWLIDPFLKLTKNKASVIFAMNSQSVKYLNTGNSKVHIMPSVAVDFENGFTKKGEGFNVLSIGRFVPLKGFDITVKAFADFYNRLDDEDKKNATLTLVGSGPSKKYLQQIAEFEGIVHTVNFIDWIDRENLKSLYAEAHVFLFPSHEGAGMVVAEALSYSTPVLCFRNSGPGEFIDSTSGVAIEYGGYEATIAKFSMNLDLLNNNRKKLSELSRGAYKRYQDYFRWDLRGNKLAEIYDEVLEEPVNEKPEILAVHLLNDFSGSPFVFRQALEGLASNGYKVKLFTSTNKSGFLSNIPWVQKINIKYRWSNNKSVRLLFYLLNQFVLFFKVLSYFNKDVIVYINTILPFGAALAGKISGKKVVYHVHETSVKPELLKRFLFWVIKITAADTIYVSGYLKDNEGVENTRMHTIYNVLPDKFTNLSSGYYPVHGNKFNVLMLCSLKEYKGVYDFVELARQVPDVNFELVLNAGNEEIDRFFEGHIIPDNLKLFPAQNDVHPFYRRSHVVLNLSHPDSWIETFGMTALEANSYGLPVIVPTVGGIAEIVIDDLNGYKIDVSNTKGIVAKILSLVNNRDLYYNLSKSAKRYSLKFSPEIFVKRIDEIMSDQSFRIKQVY